MYYASIGIIAILIHLILNYEQLRKKQPADMGLVRARYRMFLYAVLLYYCADVMWGFFYEQRWVIITFIDTTLFFFAMVLSVLLWTRSVLAFTGRKDILSKIFSMAGWFIFGFEVVVLIVNIFYPIVFTFDADKEYIPLPARYITLFMQMILYLATAIYSLAIALKAGAGGKTRLHYRTIGFSGLIMMFFIALQMFFPLMPFYSMGCMFSTCMIHSFVYRDSLSEQRENAERANQRAYRDGLTGVKNKLAYLDALKDLEQSRANGTLKEFGVVVFDLNGLKHVNDTLGHAAGDDYIKNACRIICLQYKHSPIFRVGGDEFVAILRGQDYENREELTRTFEQTIDENQKAGTVVVSSGLAIFDPEIDEDYNDVFKRADELMYARKQLLKAR